MDPLSARLTAQLLAGPPARHPVAVAERLLAIQAQDPRGGRLAIRARTEGVAAADVDRELTDTRSLLITWCNRGTLHLIRSEDYPLLQALTTPPLAVGNARRLAQEGVEPAAAERGVRLIDRLLAEEGPLTRLVLRDRLERAGIPVDGQALVHLLFRASLEGRIVRGPMVGRQHAFVRVPDWLPWAQPAQPARPPARDVALAELARRYLVGHGPATDRDLARWAGLPLRDARTGLQAIAPELSSWSGDLVDLAGRPAAEAVPLPPPRLLGVFEPLLLGWTSRADVLGDAEPRIVSGGMFRGFGLVGGRARAVWRFDGGRIEIEPLPGLRAADRRALEADAEGVRAFLGMR